MLDADAMDLNFDDEMTGYGIRVHTEYGYIQGTGMKMAGKHLVAISEISHFPSTPVEITGKTTHFLSADRPWPHKFQVGISTTLFFISHS
jgi:hypothetical protein